MPPAHWYTGLVVGIKELAPKVKSFELEIPEVVSFDFKAGQFITLDLPVGDKRLQRWRSYSISSAPAGTNKIELCIVHFDGGLGSTYFFDQVVVGTELKFKGPEGGFVLPEVIDQDVVMICTGTPTTTELGGTDRTTTALAPMRLPSPTSSDPSTLAPAPMVTRSPMVGCRLPFSNVVPPRVTP